MSGAMPEPMREMTAAYVLGALSDADARTFVAWLETSPEGQREVAELRELLPVIATAIEGPRPSTSLRTRVIGHATRASASLTPPAPTSRPVPPSTLSVAWLALAASLVALTGLTVSHLRLRSQLADRDTIVSRLQQEVATSGQQRSAAEATLTQLLDPGTSLTRLTAQGKAVPEIRFYYNRVTRTAIASAVGLSPNSAGRVYQLWFIPKGGTPIPSITFTVDAEGKALLTGIELPAGQELAAAAITDEPTGGSTQPTTTPFLVGNL